ncbi:LOW QUALITY PROTEIN: hypothetical protein PanWU01x14_070250 [Parasponia andersonii]|uniref:Uncharacterized protein n=1 Tax=Parasponia andersonii TaxID=3476 RepID=A0A2P5DEW5_PARAD|nr:LOW QUALITY PROTEIN: hypothetical protein PanWU01x14_070250 [Parasponia andersonii]
MRGCGSTNTNAQTTYKLKQLVILSLILFLERVYLY